MRILITGGCGFLGSNLAADAIGRGDHVLVLDSLCRTGSERNLAWLRTIGDFEYRPMDITDANGVHEAIAGFVPEAVFHVAGQVAMTSSLADPRRDFDVNALGTLNVLEALRRSGSQALLAYSSTNKVYGDLEQLCYEEDATRWRCPEYPAGFDELLPLSFHSPYGCSKGAAEQYVQDYHRIFGLRTIVFRHSSMYGGRQFATSDQGWVGWFCAQAARQATDPQAPACTISGDGKQVRDVLHAEDMVRLYRSALTAPDQALGQAYNVGGGMANSLSLLELFKVLEEFYARALRFTRLPPRVSDQRIFVADCAKAQRLLGWRPHVDYRTGLMRMVDWIAESGLASGVARE